VHARSATNGSDQGGKKLGDETSSPLFKRCVEKDLGERFFRASGKFGRRQNLPFNKLEISFSYFVFQPAVHCD